MAKRVYFAFHYQDVIDFRANVVRKHNFTGGRRICRLLRPFDLGRGEEDESSGIKAADKRGNWETPPSRRYSSVLTPGHDDGYDMKS